MQYGQIWVLNHGVNIYDLGANGVQPMNKRADVTSILSNIHFKKKI